MAIEAVDTGTRGLAQPPPGGGRGPRRRAAAPRLGAARSRSSGSSATGSGRSTGSRGTTRAARRPRGRGCTRASGRCSSSRCSSSIPRPYRRLRRPIYFGTLGVMVFVLAAGAVTRGSRRWIDVGFFTFQPSEFGKVLFVLVLAGFLAERARSIGSPGARRSRALGYGLVPIVLVFVQPDIGTALVYCRGARRRAVRRRRALVAPRHPGDADRGGRARRPLAAAGGGRERAQAVPGGAPHRLHAPGQRPAGRDVQPAPVDHRRRRRRPARPRRARRDADAARTTCRSTRPTSPSPRSPSSAASSAPRSCCCSTCSSSGARSRSSPARATSTARSSPAGSRSCSCSRCS